MAATSSVFAKIPKVLREQIDEITRLERRTSTDVTRMAIEQFVSQYTKLHPQFRADIQEALSRMEACNAVPYERG